MKTIAITNQKGGVGKTTTTVNLGAALADMGKKILLIDFDPQGNLSASYNIMPNQVELSVYEMLKGEADINDVIVTVERPGGSLDILPANINLSGVEIELSTKPGREFILKECLGKLKNDYDYVLIDCPPSLGVLTLNALTASNKFIIPLASEYLALFGTGQLMQVVSVVKERIHPELELLGVVITQHDARKVHCKETADQIIEFFGNKVYKTVIRSNVSLTEAPSFNKDIFTYRPKSAGAEDYLALAKEFVKGV
jgi:chromosome partitioning protein